MQIAAITANIAADITNKSALDSITQADVGDNMTDVANEHINRGTLVVAATSDLAAVSAVDTLKVFVRGRGLFEWTASLPTTGDFYAALTSGYWLYRDQKPDNILLTKERVNKALFQLAAGAVNDTLEPFTKVGAFLTSTDDKAGSFDRFLITGGTASSVIRFTKLIGNDHRQVCRLRLKANDVGSTAPLLGLGYIGQQMTNDTGSPMGHFAFVNLLTKTVTFTTDADYVSGVSGLVSKSNSAGTLAVDGDVLEIELKTDPANNRMIFTVVNETTGEWLIARLTVNVVRSLGYNNKIAELLMADGQYTVLAFEGRSSVNQHPLLGMMGDSYIMGDNTQANVGWGVRMHNALPYDVLEVAGNGSYVLSMNRYQLPEIMRYKPKYVLVSSILAIFYGYFNSADANQTAFDAAFSSMMNSIVAYGGKPILIKWQNSGGFLNAHGTAWNTAVNGYLVTWPTTLVLDFSALTFLFNVNSHPASSDFATMAQKLTELLRSDGVIF